jgi:hypothetical protein
VLRNLSNNNKKYPSGLLKVVAYEAYINGEKTKVVRLSRLVLKQFATISVERASTKPLKELLGF